MLWCVCACRPLYRETSFMQRALHTFLTAAGTWMARPVAFAAVVIYAILWTIFDRSSLDFHGTIALLTLFMTLFIQRSEHRDTRQSTPNSMNCFGPSRKAKTSLTGMDEQEPEQIEAERDEARAHDPA